jgi:uncharacterized protein
MHTTRLIGAVAGCCRQNVNVEFRVEVRMAGKFELYKDAAGKFRFRLKASNGELIATGEAYESKSSALNGIDSVKRNAPGAEVIDQTT